MSDYWYKNPIILINNYDKFFPCSKYSKIEKVNSIALFGIYYAIIIIIFKLNTKFISISICLIILSIFLGVMDKYEMFINKTTNYKCVHPTRNNPFMNFTLGDHIMNPNRLPACDTDDVRNEELANYRNNNIVELGDLYGKTITDRNFYTMPSTTIVNDLKGFLDFTYGDFGKCKSEGKDCLKNIDTRFSRGRYYVQY